MRKAVKRMITPIRETAEAGQNEPAHAFSTPWRMAENMEAFEIKDATGRRLASVYFDDNQLRRELTKRLSKQEARTMARRIARLPELVRIAQGIDPDDDY